MNRNAAEGINDRYYLQFVLLCLCNEVLTNKKVYSLLNDLSTAILLMVFNKNFKAIEIPHQYDYN
jgi:hypothetical protein